MTDAESPKQITEDQHFVPKFYMRRFANEKGFLEVLDRQKGKLIKPRPYSGVCYSQFYYAKKTGEPDELSQDVEEVLKNLEDNISVDLPVIYEKIINYKQITQQERYTIAVLAAMLWLRVEYMRRQVNRMSENLLKEIMTLSGDKRIAEVRDFLESKKGGFSFDNSTHLALMMQFQGFSNMCFGKNWIVYLAKGEKKFITSDTPVVEWIPDRKGFYGPSFLERKHYLVLSPTVLIEMRYPIPGTKKILKRKWIYDDQVLEFNRMRVELSCDYCYAQRKDELEELVRERDKNMEEYFHLLRSQP